MKMEIVLTEEEVRKMTAKVKSSIEKGEFNKCYFCAEINRFLKDTIFFWVW